MSVTCFPIFPDWARDKRAWIGFIVVILGILFFNLNKNRTITMEIDLSGYREQCEEFGWFKRWFTTQKICYKEEMRRTVTLSGLVADVHYAARKLLPNIPGLPQVSYTENK